MQPQFPRRLFGYSPRTVAAAFAQLEAEQAQELDALEREAAHARGITRGLERRLADLETRFKDTEARIQVEMLQTIQMQGLGQKALEDAALRHREQQEQIKARIAEREAVLVRVEEAQNRFGAELRAVIARVRGAAAELGGTTVELNRTPPPNSTEERQSTEGSA